VCFSARQSQELARQQLEFVAGVSHELRTPLAVIRSAGDNLAEGVVHDEVQVRKYGALVRDEGRRLTGMVEQILELSGIHSGQRALQVAPVALAGLIDGVLTAAGASIRDAGIRVDVSIPPDLPPVAGDAAGLTRVFHNLIENAVKYGAGGSWIGIAAQCTASDVRVSIRDRGRGIAPADQPRVFDPFYRAADVVAAQIPGAGLGLSLVRRLVEAHGGRIGVTSTRGSGSEFVVHLPIASGHAAPDGPGTGALPSRPAAAGGR
jgi:signal transduction histidine kinase